MRNKISTMKALIITMLLSFMFAGQSWASHFAGGEFRYQCISNNQYRVTMIFYRDCDGITEPSSVPISISSTCSNTSATLAKKPNGGGFVNGSVISNTCGSVLSTCDGGTAPGLRKWIYEGVITLPTNTCNLFTISYDDCCRNGVITSLNNPGGTGYYVECKINRSVCNNSPVFSNDPLAFACANQPFNYNQAALDAEGDSLFYMLDSPKDENGNSVIYNFGYSLSNPLLNTGGFNLNPTTGAVNVTPNTVQIGVFTVKVKEYRNGILIGETNRDIEIFVTNCGSNAVPELSGFDGTNSNTLNACAGNNTCADITSSDANTAQSLTLSWNDGISTATFNTGSGTRPTGTFCWTPSLGDISSNPHVFTVTVKDNACPINGVAVYTYTVNVYELSLSGSTTADVGGACNGGVNTNVSGNIGTVSYQWSNGATTSDLTNVCAGTYTVTATDSEGCSKSQSFIVVGDTKQCDLKIVVRGGEEGWCKTGGIITVNMFDGKAPYTVVLTNTIGTVNITKTSQIDFAGFNNLGFGDYEVTVTDQEGCTVSATTSIAWDGCGAPTNLTVTNVTDKSAKVSWTVCNGNKFKVYYKNQTTGMVSYVTVNSTNFANLAGLVADTRYGVKVRTICSPTKSSMYTLPKGFCTGNCSNKIMEEDFDVRGAINADNFVIVSPNVTNGFVTVSAVLESSASSQIIVTNAVGQTIFTEDIDQGVEEFSRQIDLSGLNNAIYFVTVRNGNSMQTAKVVKY
ncbi:MAG: fibronectin type III domain-containing protein [Bacteroidetes bacterium]|nr:fibronectin type III domain-containing protein [Bacteroidota bacterium]